MLAALPTNIVDVLNRADHESSPVRLTFRDGTQVTARIRDLDQREHRSITYLDMDGSCGIRVAPLEDIMAADPA